MIWRDQPEYRRVRNRAHRSGWRLLLGVLGGTVLGGLAWGGLSGLYCGLLFTLIGIVNFGDHQQEKDRRP